VLRDHILAMGDREVAAHAYATEHDQYYAALHRMEMWIADLRFTAGPEADARRARVWQRLAEEPDFQSRFPDNLGLGPDGPNVPEELRSLG
jgi:hypothetical protein